MVTHRVLDWLEKMNGKKMEVDQEHDEKKKPDRKNGNEKKVDQENPDLND
jgi:hypothetical protein